LLKEGDIAIDVGANIGYDSMLMSMAVGASGKVLAFEPDTQNLERLLENLRQLPVSNVIVQSVGAGDRLEFAGIAAGHLGNAGTSHLRPNAVGPTRPMLVARIDQVLPATELGTIALVKIDVEGFEHKAILGMGALLDSTNVVICEIDRAFLRDCGSSPEAVFATMEGHGFLSFCAQPNSKERWRRSGPDYKIEVRESSHYDALFCKSVPPELSALIEAGG
jgi:FkbM family methyltransferase